MRKLSTAALMVLIVAVPAVARAQGADGLAQAIHILDNYRVVPNVTYLTANNYDAKLDIYQARNATTPNQTLIYVHGGGWMGGTKEQSGLTFLPFLEMGWSVVNVEYRLART